MLSSIVRLAASRTASDERQQLRAAVRQLDRAELYLVAAAHMEIGDPGSVRAIEHLRAEIKVVQKQLTERAIRLRS